MNRTFDTNPNFLLERVYGEITIDLVHESGYINHKVYGELAEPDKGLYFRGFLKPYITDRDRIYDAKTNEHLDPIYYFTDQVYTSPVTVVISRDDRLIRANESISLAKLLQGHPDIPVSECELVLLAAVDYLNDNTAAVSGTDICKSYDELFMVNYQSLRGDGLDLPAAVSYDLTPLLIRKLDRFIADDEWSMYSVSVSASTLTVQKHMDWRAWMYHREMWERGMKSKERLAEWTVAGYDGDSHPW